MLPSPWGAVVVAAAVVFDTAETLLMIHWSKRRRAAVGAESLVGKPGVAVGALTPEGQVKVGEALGALRRVRRAGHARRRSPASRG